ncbi:Protein kinase NEK family protein [Giardia duodenalis]|uniref:Protein kinase NEK family protein n=1 Tax=Giardia intestinalis TaxID=5741 RepID=V6TMW2_GIAIN|nr:Protein kinase NEK family protein [Giardia intestinalis]
MISKSFVLVTESARLGFSAIPAFNRKELQEREDELLDKGTFGAVRSIKGCPRLAVKEIYLSGQPDRLKEITKFELEALSRFSHPGVLKYHQVLSNDDFVYIIMDRYDGDLQHFITDHKSVQKHIPRELLLSIVRQLADALAYVHAPYKVNEEGDVLPGIVHRDLKPANVLMNRDGDRVAIADFGLCKDVMHDGSTFAGSPAYMAPEVFIHSKTSRASDIWAFGVIIYELITLKRPSFSHYWEPEDAKEFFVDGWRPDLSAVKDEFTRMILEKIFVVDPIERPTARELADRLRILSTSDNEPGTWDPLSAKKHELQVVSDSGSFKASSSWTPLMRAAAAGDIKAVKRHLSKKGKKDNRKDMALIIAAKAGHIDVVELIDPTDGDGVTALMRAVDRNDIGAMRALIPLQKGKKMIEDTYINGLRISSGTALMMAAAHGHAEAVKLLVEEESNIRDSAGKTALMHAVHNNHPEVIRILVTHDCGKTYSSGRTALMIAAERGHTEIVAALAPHEKGLADSSGNTALMLAANNARTEAVRWLAEYERGARDSHGRTALMTAARRGDLEMGKVFAEHEKGITDEDGRTALVNVTRAGHREAAEILMEHEKDVTGWTMLMCAAYLGDISMIFQNLGEKGQRDKLGQTALILAAQIKRNDAVKLLIAYEGSISGWTSLIYGAYLGDVDAIRNNLHENGYKDIIEMTALMWAAYQGHKEAVEVLIEHEKGMSDSQNHNALLGSQDWAHGSCRGHHSPRGPGRRERRHRAHASRRQRRH